MQYIEYTFELQPTSGDFQDVLEAVLADVGFDSFVKDEDGQSPLKAYIRKELLDEAAVSEAIKQFPLPTEVSYTSKEAENKNWNEEWEKNFFEPLVIEHRCVVSAPFHHDVPQADYHVLIEPRMSFGTGHHETTFLMLNALLSADIEGKRVLDMGCGTSLLAILSRMRGAASVVAIDNDEWCTKNSLDNIALNHLDHIEVYLGDASLLPTVGHFDLILANIHLNIIQQDLAAYADCLAEGGQIIVSGFYIEDADKLLPTATRLGLEQVEVKEKKGWCSVTFRKPA